MASDALCVGRDLNRPIDSFLEPGAAIRDRAPFRSPTAIRRSGASAPYVFINRNRVLRAGECPFDREEHPRQRRTPKIENYDKKVTFPKYCWQVDRYSYASCAVVQEEWNR